MDHTGKVLVVEDDVAVRQAVAEVLESEGFVAEQAGDGASALALLQAPEARPDVILLDLMMPVMNGWQFRTAQLQDPDLAEIPVVVMSAMDASGVQADASILKPFDVDQLVATVERVARGPRQPN
ncbi:MAG TPA: response regulator [Anaeromyxobacteraceae bacterium]|jgi:CheY-like chemotaxis protein|nr:response regulator [Anaeromyxobacteraceae bacterium]